MTFATIVKSKFPNVSNLPGVPQLARSASVITNLSAKVLSQSTNARTIASFFSRTPVWGVYDNNGQLLVEPDTILDFSLIDSWKIAQYPVQAGSFSNFNKVANPDEIVLRFFKAGNETERSAFLLACTNLIDSLDVCKIVTPERSYLSMNAMRQEVIRREKEGAFTVEVDISFEEIRIVSAQYDVTNAQVIAADTTNAQSSSAIPSTNMARISAKLPGTVGHRPDGSIVSKLPKSIAIPSEQ